MEVHRCLKIDLHMHPQFTWLSQLFRSHDRIILMVFFSLLFVQMSPSYYYCKKLVVLYCSLALPALPVPWIKPVVIGLTTPFTAYYIMGELHIGEFQILSLCFFSFSQGGCISKPQLLQAKISKTKSVLGIILSR